ncbi:MAG TPA: sulfatase-like hydrolase/transferase [Planctomycetota bacterium]
MLRASGLHALRCLALLLALGAAGCGRDAPARPNIVLVLADDLVAGALGFEGNALARTPHLDALARGGARFLRAYVPTPQCAPSRAALLLGVPPHASGMLANREEWDRGRPTLAQVLRTAGYRTGFVGKWHLGEDEVPQAGFESWCAIDRRGFSYYDPVLHRDGRAEPRQGYVPSLLTDEALRFLAAEDERPFFLWLAYTSPHEPLQPPPDPDLAHDPARFALPESMGDDLSGKPAAQRASAEHELFRAQTPETLRAVRALYQSVVDALDREVGRLLEGLARAGLREETLVVFLSDNGTLAGEHQMVTKGPAFYEELVRTPLVVSWPGTIAPAELEALASSLDLFPTLARLAGAAPPADLAGLDLGPLLAGADGAARRELFFEYARKRPDDEPTPMLGWVDARHKYVLYLSSNEEELYDLVADPRELRNLAAREPELLAEARTRLAPYRARAERALR